MEVKTKKLMAGTSQELLSESTQIACGNGSSYCGEALASHYETVMRADPCAIATSADYNTSVEDYVLWLPKYKRQPCEGSGYINCSAEAERFGPRQVTQESFLQGRGQVTSNRGCTGGFVNYLPESQFPARKPRSTDMTLFAQPTVVPRSCGTLTEVDLQKRIDPLPSEWQGSWSPFVGMLKFGEEPRTGRDPRIPTGGSKAKETVTLGSKNKYPEWGDLKRQSEPYSQ